MVSEPIFKKEVKMGCEKDCEEAFDKIKEYPFNEPILVLPQPDIPAILYLTTMATTI